MQIFYSIEYFNQLLSSHITHILDDDLDERNGHDIKDDLQLNQV